MMNTTISSSESLSTSIDFGICRTSEISPFIDLDFAPQKPVSVSGAGLPQQITCALLMLSACMALVHRFLFKRKGFRLHLVGIAPPAGFSKSTLSLLDNVDTSSTLLSVHTALEPDNTIADLRAYLRELYSIDVSHQLVILFSHHALTDSSLTLREAGLTHDSLLTLAICARSTSVTLPAPEPEPVHRLPTPPPPEPVESDSESETDSDYHDEVNGLFGMYSDYEADTPEPVADVNELFGMFKRYESSPEAPEPVEETPEAPEPQLPLTWPRLGFDVIMQEDNVLVHKMPGCSHEMNHESLYLYALNTFSEAKNMYLTCPHSEPRNLNGRCSQRWQYKEILDILKYQPATQKHKHNHNQEEKWMDCAKLELLCARNTVQKQFDCQKCPTCSTVYYRNQDRPGKIALEDIKLKHQLEEQFKFECVVCPAGSSNVEVMVSNPAARAQRLAVATQPEAVPGVHNEDLIEEEIDGGLVNAMFAQMEADSDDEESDIDQDDSEALHEIEHMFDFDEPDEIAVLKEKPHNSFCFCCGEEWIEDHVCDPAFRRDLIEILEMAETKKIGQVDGVPSVRACPKCSQLIFHTEACKHMNCSQCGLDFCFVCLLPMKDGNWQCGSHSDVCPIAARQNEDTLPDTVVITKQAFQLY